MTAKQQLQQELQPKFIRNYKEVLQLLLDIFEPSSPHYSFVILLMRRAETNERDRSVMELSNYSMEENTISRDTLNLISKISEEEAKTYLIKTAKFNKILVLCKDEQRPDDIQRIFSKRYYKGLTIKHITGLLPIRELKEYELIIFDNFPNDGYHGIEGILKSYLDLVKEEQIPMLYFGPHLSELQDEAYSEYIYFANSKFSIHSRIEEMLLYLKYEQKEQ
jgi:hypothetical protein